MPGARPLWLAVLSFSNKCYEESRTRVCATSPSYYWLINERMNDLILFAFCHTLCS